MTCETNEEMLERWNREDDEDERETRKLKNHTIERCAQVAHSFRERFVNHPMEMADAIAAAIRKLKDK